MHVHACYVSVYLYDCACEHCTETILILQLCLLLLPRCCLSSLSFLFFIADSSVTYHLFITHQFASVHLSPTITDLPFSICQSMILPHCILFSVLLSPSCLLFFLVDQSPSQNDRISTRPLSRPPSALGSRMPLILSRQHRCICAEIQITIYICVQNNVFQNTLLNYTSLHEKTLHLKNIPQAVSVQSGLGDRHTFRKVRCVSEPLPPSRPRARVC